MKHIKLFEGHPYYTSITSDEFDLNLYEDEEGIIYDTIDYLDIQAIKYYQIGSIN